VVRLYHPPGLVTDCYNRPKPLDFPCQACHTMGMNNETLSPDVLAFLAEFEADLGVPLDFDADEDLTDLTD
jgi:hypothetical protein